MRSSFLFFSVILMIALAREALAEVRLPRLVGDHMVLQRDSKIAIWGWADPGEPGSNRFPRSEGSRANRRKWAVVCGAGALSCRRALRNGRCR